MKLMVNAKRDITSCHNSTLPFHWYKQAEISEIFSSWHMKYLYLSGGMIRFGSHYEFPSVLYTSKTNPGKCAI